MRHSRLWLSAAIVALVVFAGFALSVPRARDVARVPAKESAPAPVPAVQLHDALRKGQHTVSGSLLAPNACATVNARAVLVGDALSPSGILVELTMTEDVGVCLQVPTKAVFSATIAAPPRLPIEATVNGLAASTTVS